ncbi:MAG: hypothetical protein BGO87_10965 [Flavobacteriia bacterium 40-80]|nr:MAG: hypothetical protein BGO87_10965 [Flavobacteriia bacterium 40-80]
MNSATIVHQPLLKKRGLIAYLLLLNMTAPLSVDMYLPAFPTIISEFITNETMLNYTLIGFLVSFSVGMLFIGPISDKFGRKPILTTGIIIYSFASLMCAFSATIEMLIIFRVLQAAGAGGMVSVSTAMVRDAFDDEARPKIIAILQMLAVFAPTLAPIIGAFIVKHTTWRVTFLLLTALSGISLILSFLLKETLPKEKRVSGNILNSFYGLIEIGKNRSFMYFLIASGSCSMVYMAFIAVSSYIYIQFFGLSEETYSIFFAVNSLVLMVGPNIYILVRKMIPPTKIPLISYSSIFIAGILIATIGRQNEYLFLLTFMPVTLSLSFLRAFSTSTLLAQPDMNGGATSSMINFTNTALGAFGMLLTSLPWINHIVGVGSIAIISMLISGIMMLLFHRNGLKLQGYN